MRVLKCLAGSAAILMLILFYWMDTRGLYARSVISDLVAAIELHQIEKIEISHCRFEILTSNPIGVETYHTQAYQNNKADSYAECKKVVLSDFRSESGIPNNFLNMAKIKSDLENTTVIFPVHSPVASIETAVLFYERGNHIYAIYLSAGGASGAIMELYNIQNQWLMGRPHYIVLMGNLSSSLRSIISEGSK